MLLTMSSSGLVSIPGMMVGQILCGASPLLSVKYQIAILLAMTLKHENESIAAKAAAHKA